jgi:hypothetical protein
LAENEAMFTPASRAALTALNSSSDQYSEWPGMITILCVLRLAGLLCTATSSV